ADDPQLNCRLYEGRNPVRIICDTTLRTPITSFVVTDAKVNRTIIATACRDKEKQQPYLQAGCEILELEKDENGVDLNQLMDKLGESEIDSVLLEGGATLNWSALRSGIIRKIQVYIGAKIFGGIGAKSPIGGTGFEEVENMYHLEGISYTPLGEDLLIESEVVRICSPEL
ncbi:MAG: RibD family protein, partial [Clostridia bacterium]|nr:RibD family protein [Clostridia bacterium]